MENYQKSFIELAINQNALRFGEFKLKSGRISPYFFNMGQLNTGHVLKSLGESYAHAIVQSDIQYDVLFGPAYKGIPLACATAIALSSQYHLDIPYAFNRKEVKDHGEGGLIIGAPLNQRVLIIDDVITAGTAVRESLQIIEAEKGKIAGIIVALDRQEVVSLDSPKRLSSIQEIQNQYNIPVKAIISFTQIMDYVLSTPQYESYIQPLKDYRKQYGVD
jgi:orotate phosphoribosyltransferase